jgi:hypothetical protein
LFGHLFLLVVRPPRAQVHRVAHGGGWAIVLGASVKLFASSFLEAAPIGE